MDTKKSLHWLVRFMLAGICGSGALSLGCTQRSLAPADTLVTIISNPILNLDPRLATDANVQHINQLIHATLTRTGADLTPEPYLAESFTAKDHSLLITLRANCRFQDSSLIEAADVVAAIEKFLEKGFASPFLKNFSMIEKVSAQGNREVLIHLKHPAPSLLFDLSVIPIIPRAQSYAEPNGGAGPYRVERNGPQGILLSRVNFNSCFPQPPMAKIEGRVVRDDLSRFLKLRQGEIDLVVNELDYRKVKKIIAGEIPKLKAIALPGTTISYMGMNLRNPALKDLRVRKAIVLALDIEALITHKLVGFAEPAASLLSRQSWYSATNLKPVRRDLATARKLLNEAGFYNGENSLPPLKLTLKTTTYRPIVENARAIKEQLREVGIEIEHRAYEWGTFYGDVRARNTELFLLRWVGVAAPDLLREIFHSDRLLENNRTEFINPEMDAALDRATKTMDSQERRKWFVRAQEIAAAELPYALLWHNFNAASFNERLENVELAPTGDWYPLLKIRKRAP